MMIFLSDKLKFQFGNLKAQILKSFENTSGALSSADAHGYHAVFLVSAFHFIKKLNCEFRS
jgi:hypothetical protein